MTTFATSFSEDDNIGSLRTLALVAARSLSSVNPVTFKAGYDWQYMDFLPESAGVKDASKDTTAGTEYTYQLSFAFNKQNKPMYDAFAAYIGITGVVMFTDNNGLTRIIGTPKNPVTINHEADTGGSYSSLNYYKISITWASERPAVVVL